MLSTRYTVVSAPFILVALAALVRSLPRPLGVGLACALLAVAVAGSIRSHRDDAFYPDARAAVADIRKSLRQVAIGQRTAHQRSR